VSPGHGVLAASHAPKMCSTANRTSPRISLVSTGSFVTEIYIKEQMQVTTA
jgi:hypothetical protein